MSARKSEAPDSGVCGECAWFVGRVAGGSADRSRDTPGVGGEMLEEDADASSLDVGDESIPPAQSGRGTEEVCAHCSTRLCVSAGSHFHRLQGS